MEPVVAVSFCEARLCCLAACSSRGVWGLFVCILRVRVKIKIHIKFYIYIYIFVVFGSSLQSSVKIQLLRNSFGALFVSVLQMGAGHGVQCPEHLTPNKTLSPGLFL